MTDIITVIAYKENAVDTCRGCVMSRHDSAFEMFSSDKPDAVVDFVADLRAKDLDEYNSFDFTFLVNGRCIHYNNYIREDFTDELDYEMIEKYEETVNQIIKEADDRMKMIIQQRKEAKEHEAHQKEIAAKRNAEKIERWQYEQLKAKYEGGEG